MPRIETVPKHKKTSRTGRGECGDELDLARTVVDSAVPAIDLHKRGCLVRPIGAMFVHEGRQGSLAWPIKHHASSSKFRFVAASK